MNLFNSLLKKIHNFSSNDFKIRHLQELIIDHLPNYFIFWKDINGKYLGCNQAFAKLAGQKSSADLIGKSDYDYWSKEESDAYVADDKLVMQTGQPKFDIEEPQTTPWGEHIILSTSKVPLFDEHGKVYGLLGVCCNVTQQKLIEQNVHNLNLKLEKECQNKSKNLKEILQPLNVPLTNILKNALLIQDENMQNNEIKHNIKQVLESTTILKNLLEDLMAK